VICGRRFTAHASVGKRQRTCGAACREEDGRRQRRRRRLVAGDRYRQSERARQQRHRAKAAKREGPEAVSGRPVSRPELTTEVITEQGDEVEFLASRVRDVWAELRSVSRRVQELSSRSARGRKAQKSVRGPREVAGCHAQS
jgi:hypothetical protein